MEINFALFLAPIILWILAIVIGSGKANFLIAGYNTASKEEKAKINEKYLYRFMGKFLFLLGIIQLIPAVADIFKVNNLSTVVLVTNVVFFIIVILGIVYMNTSKRFDK